MANLPDAWAHWQAQRDARARLDAAAGDESPPPTGDTSRDVAGDTSSRARRDRSRDTLPAPAPGAVTAAGDAPTGGDEASDPSAMGDPPAGESAGDLFKRGQTRLRVAMATLDKLAPRYRRQEITTAGFDDMLQGVVADPFRSPAATGVRFPALPHVGYSICTAVELNAGDRLVAWNAYLTIATLLGPESGAPPFSRVEIDVTTVSWRFADSAHAFVLTHEPYVPDRIVRGFDSVTGLVADQDSFRLNDGTSAMVYNTCANATGPQGYLGLTAYTPPAILGRPMFTNRDTRNAFKEGEYEYLNLEVDRPMRFRGYVWAFQTDPATRPFQAIAADNFVTTAIPPEEAHVQKFQSAANVIARPRYWRGGVRFIIDRRIP